MNQIDNYIQSFLNGSLGAEGHTVLRQWIKEKPENRYYFQAQVAIWKATGVISNAEEFDVTGAINRFNKKAKTPLPYAKISAIQKGCFLYKLSLE